jgi:hypothetical protein
VGQVHQPERQVLRGVRERLPHLPALADAAGRCLAETTALLAAAAEREPDEVFDHAGTRYRRKVPWSAGRAARHQGSPSVTENLVTGETVNLTRREDEAFWAWAIIETLRLSGIFSAGQTGTNGTSSRIVPVET